MHAGVGRTGDTHVLYIHTHTHKSDLSAVSTVIPSPTAHTGAAGMVDSNQRG